MNDDKRLASTPQAAPTSDAEDAARMALLVEHWQSTIEGKRLHEWLGDIGTLLYAKAIERAVWAKIKPQEGE